MSLEQTLERIAVSLETLTEIIAKGDTRPTAPAETKVATTPSENKTEVKEDDAKKKAEAKAKKEERAKVIEALKELGQEVKTQHSTATLQKQLSKAIETKNQQELEVEAPVEERAEVPSIDQVREVLKNYAAENGKPKTLALLGSFKAKNASEIKDADRAAFIEKATETTDDFLG